MLKKKAKSAVIWSGVDVFIRQGLSFSITIILARMLAPEDFGTIALLAIFFGLAGLFTDAGFSAALIQKQDVNHVDESTVFWFNIIIACFITGVIFFSAPWVAGFFELPILVDLTKVLAFTVFISSLGSIHITLLTKQLNFKIPFMASVIAVCISGSVAVFLAWKGFGVWALVAQVIIGGLINSLFLWLLHKWRPLWVFDIDSLKSMFNFSGYIFAAGILQVLYERSYAILIGKLFGVRDLGLYDRADSTQKMVGQSLTNIVAKVTFPLYSKLAHDIDKLRNIVQLSIRSSMFIIVPVMLGLAAVANVLIPFVFGGQWTSMVVIFQVLCLASVFSPIHSANVSVLKAQGRADLNFRLNVIKKLFGITFLLIGSLYGVTGVAWACVLQSLVALMINGHYSKKFLDYGTVNQLQDCFSSLAIGGLMAGVMLYVEQLYDPNGFLGLLCLIATGFFLYIGLHILLGVTAYKEAIIFVRRGKVINE